MALVSVVAWRPGMPYTGRQLQLQAGVPPDQLQDVRVKGTPLHGLRDGPAIAAVGMGGKDIVAHIVGEVFDFAVDCPPPWPLEKVSKGFYQSARRLNCGGLDWTG